MQTRPSTGWAGSRWRTITPTSMTEAGTATVRGTRWGQAYRALTSGGSALFRGVFLSRLVARASRTDAFYLEMLEAAEALRTHAALDVNGDGMVDERDAAVLYYAYLRGVLLYPSLGGSALFRGAFFSRLVDRANRSDAFYLEMLKAAESLRGN